MDTGESKINKARRFYYSVITKDYNPQGSGNVSFIGDTSVVARMKKNPRKYSGSLVNYN
jgi:hypothetical protein